MVFTLCASMLRTNLSNFVNGAPDKLTVRVLNPRGKHWMYNMNDALKRIFFVPIHSLISHEATIPDHVQKMNKTYSDRGFVTRIVQATSLKNKKYMIIDAHHLTKLLADDFGVKSCCVFNHDYSTLPIRAWYPVSKLKPREILSMCPVAHSECTLDSGRKMLDSNQASFLVLSADFKNSSDKSTCYALHCNSSFKNIGLSQLVESQASIISLLDSNGAISNYVPDDKCFSCPGASTILMRRPFKHEEVILHASNGNVFPPKSTRHEFCIEVRIPLLGELHYLNANEANTLLRQLYFTNFKFLNLSCF